MPKVSSRFRNRKINFKSAVPIYVGSLDLPFEEDVDAGTGTGTGTGQSSAAGHGSPAPSSHHNIVPPPGFSINEQGETVRVETGVDKEEEHEHHLQAVISASAAALSRSARGAPGSNAGGPPAKPLIAHIPTPDATGLVANYTQFYNHNAYTDPHSYIRSSETVEETMGIAYTMDEDDEDFLEAYNSEAKENRKPGSIANGKDRASRSPSPAENGNYDSTPPSPAPADGSLIARNGHYPPLNPISSLKRGQPRNEKSTDTSSGPPSTITEDDFEVVMDLFERITDRKCPTLHLDVSRIPQLEDLEPSFATYLPQSVLKNARSIAKIVYPHWKERRLAAGGKNIVPQLNFDITSETAYVCFRRREVKQARKTRRTDTQTLERLVRLKSDLSSAYELLLKVLDRERCKRDTISNEISIFDSRTLLRETKRKLGENDGDESLLIARRKEKKRRRDEYGQQAGSNKIVIPSRAGLVPVTPGLLQEALPPYKDRTVNANQRIEKDMQRKKEQETGWEDYTDSAFSPLPLSFPSRCWRSTEDVHLPASDSRPAFSYTAFESHMPPVVQQIGQRYRKRSGRGGRLLLDRLVRCSMTPFFSREAGLDAEAVKRREERWRYDSDASNELPQSRHPCVVDDYETRYSAGRIALMSGPDLESLYPNTAHLEEAFRWQMREPDRLPPVQVTGKLPGQRIATHAVQQGSNGPVNGGGVPHMGPVPSMNGQVPAHLANQMMQAAQRMSAAGLPNGAGHQQQQQMMQQQQQQQQQQSPVGSAVQPARRSGSAGSVGGPLPNGASGHAVQPPQIRRLMWENGGGG